MRKFKRLVTTCLMSFTGLVITAEVLLPGKFENVPPEVLILSPTGNDTFIWGNIIQYKISIKDKEDGDSKYDEIAAKDVLLEVSYLPDEASAKIYADKKKNNKEDKGLTLIRRSDCFSCHASKSKLIGPSFELIANRYPMTDSSVKRLTNSIVNGSVGTWSGIAMPAHKTIETAEGRLMVTWLLNNGGSKNSTLYPGIEGAFKTADKPPAGSAKAVMVLTASYTDHGDKGSMLNNMYGHHTIFLKPAN